MAEILEAQQLLGESYEPKRKNRWIFSIEGLDSFTAKMASRPQISFDETVIDYINNKRYVAGKATFQPLNITLLDPIVPSESQKVIEWLRLCYEPQTGRMGYAQFYQKTINMKLLDPVGAVVEDWEFQNTWIQDANFNDLDYTSSEPADISLVLRYDRFVLLY